MSQLKPGRFRKRHDGPQNSQSVEAQGETGRVVGATHGDIANQGSAEDVKLRTLFTAFDQNSMVVLVTGPGGRIEYVNARFTEITGYSAAEAIGQNPRMLNSRQTPRETYAEMWDKIVRGLQWGGEFLNRRKSGELFWVEAHISPVKNQAGVITHFVGIMLDITERKQAEKFRLVQARLEEADRLIGQVAQLDRQRSLGEISASISHELNQPLSAILTNAQVAQRGMLAGRFEPAQIGEFLDKIILNTRRASEIIDKIRGFIRPKELELLPVDLNKVARDVLDLMGGDAAEHKVAVIFSPFASPMWVRGDAVQLSQVLFNLYRNAIEALEHCTQREIHVQLMRFGERVSLSVCDTGPGLAPHDLEQAGSCFYTTKANGLGVGLSICRSIISRHQGILTIGNAGGGGACVDIDLPALQQEQQERL